MPSRCVVGECSNTPNLAEGIALHFIPFACDERPKARKRRKKWVDFVQSKRARWEPTKNSAVCSKHFAAEDFNRRFSSVPGQEKGSFPRLKRDEMGVCVFPTIQTASATTTQSSRSKKMIIKSAIRDMDDLSAAETSGAKSTSQVQATLVEEVTEPLFTQVPEGIDSEHKEVGTTDMTTVNKATQTQKQTNRCKNCIKLKSKTMHLKNKIVNRSSRLKKLKREVVKYKRVAGLQLQGVDKPILEPLADDDCTHIKCSTESEEEYQSMEQEPDSSSDSMYEPESDAVETESEEEDCQNKTKLVSMGKSGEHW